MMWESFKSSDRIYFLPVGVRMADFILVYVNIDSCSDIITVSPTLVKMVISIKVCRGISHRHKFVNRA